MQLLKDNEGSVLVHMDEFSGWFKSMNQYKSGKGSDKQIWLSLWSGTDITLNRIRLEEALIICNPCVSLLGGIPPDEINSIFKTMHINDGMLNHILFSYPEPIKRTWSQKELHDDTYNAYRDTIYKLINSLREIKEAQIHSLNMKAKICWENWIKDHYKEMNQEMFNDILQGAWAKLEGYCARIALILHCCRYSIGETDSIDIDEISIQSAVKSIDYFKSHIKKMYQRIGLDKEEQKLLKILQWIQSHEKDGFCTVRDICRGKPAGCKSKDDVEAVLKKLEQRGHGKIKEAERKSIRFYLNQN